MLNKIAPGDVLRETGKIEFEIIFYFSANVVDAAFFPSVSPGEAGAVTIFFPSTRGC